MDLWLSDDAAELLGQAAKGYPDKDPPAPPKPDKLRARQVASRKGKLKHRSVRAMPTAFETNRRKH